MNLNNNGELFFILKQIFQLNWLREDFLSRLRQLNDESPLSEIDYVLYKTETFSDANATHSSEPFGYFFGQTLSKILDQYVADSQTHWSETARIRKITAWQLLQIQRLNPPKPEISRDEVNDYLRDTKFLHANCGLSPVQAREIANFWSGLYSKNTFTNYRTRGLKLLSAAIAWSIERDEWTPTITEMQENQPVGRSDENSNTHTQTLHDIEPISVTTPDEPVAVHAAEFTHLGVDLTTLALRTIALMDPSNSANHNRQKLVETPPDAANGRFWLQLLTLAQHHASFDEQFARQVAGTVDVEDVGQQLALMVQRRRIEIIENDQEQIRYKLTNLSHKLLADVPSSPISTTPDRHFRPQPTNKFLQGLRSLDPDIFDFGRGAINLMQWIWITVITDQLATRWAARPTYWYIDAIFGIVYLSLGAILLTGIIGINFYMIAAVLLIINWGERQLRRQITAR